jgi:type II protein arginine methyltransferase
MTRIGLSDIPESFRAFAAPLLAAPDPGPLLLDLLGRLGTKAPQAEAAAFALLLRRELPPQSRVQRVTDALLRRTYPAWYITAINDPHRNAAYRKAIEAAVTRDSIVLETGTGSGLFAMLAARAGARHVYACELDPFVADLARTNIARNGLADRITVLGRYEEVTLGQQMPERASILVHEFVSSEYLTAGMAKMIGGLRERLLAPDALILPQKIGVRGMLVGGRQFREAVAVSGPIEGLDLSAINPLALPLAEIPGPADLGQPLSAPQTLAEHDLAGETGPEAQARILEIPVNAAGSAEGLLQWVRHGFPDGTAYENRPGLKCNWQPIFHPFATPIPVRDGQTLRVRVACTETEIFLDPAEVG